MMATTNNNGENGRSLPDGWEWSTVASSVKNISLTGKKLPQRDYLETGKIPVVDQGQEFIGGYTDLEELVVKCEPPVIIFGDHTKAIKFVPMPFVAGADGIKVLKPLERFNPKLLYYFLQAVELPDKGYARHFQYLEKAEIPVPPLPEQERIVSRIEELLSDLDAGVAALERVRAGLKRYKASVLKAACEGKLFGDVELGEEGLPMGWRWTTVGEIGEISGGLTKNSKRDALKMKMPYLRVANVYANELQLDDVSEIGVEEKEIKRALLQDGDLLVVEGNGSPDQIGRVAIWNGSISPCLHQNHIIKVRFEPKEVAEYVLYWLLSESGREQITKVASSTSGLYTLSLSKVSNLPVPLPPLDEQRRIVAEVERRLSVVGEVESAVEVGLVRAGRVRQSVLRSAFEGRL